jgi:glycosyltransferase XagB
MTANCHEQTFKGWIQTWFVHMRRPVRLFRDLRPAGAAAFQLFFTCNVLAALIHPAFMAALGFALFASPKAWAAAAMSRTTLIFVATLLSGYASTVVVDLFGLQRRGLLAHAWVLFLTPIYWFLLSLAAWRAVFQLLGGDPQRWEKTEHGLARTSRQKTPHKNASGAQAARPIRRQSAAREPSTFGPIAPIRIMQTPRGPMIG